MEIADQLCDIINKRRLAELTGIHDPEGQPRLVEPHAVYIGSNNRGFVDFYQRSGFSRSGGLPGWRRFALSDVASVEPLPKPFEPREDYQPENRQWYRAFVCTTEKTPAMEATEPDAEQPAS